MRGKICAFIGYSPGKFFWLFDESDRDYALLKEVLKKQLTNLVEDGVTTFMVSFASGTDSWAASVVRALKKKKIPVRLQWIFPHTMQTIELAKFMWEENVKSLQWADSVAFVNQCYAESNMMECDAYMVENCDVFLTIYDGKSHGFMADIVRYARKLGREVVILDPLTREISRE